MTFKEKALSFRHKLGLVFDDNLDTRQWYNIVDWVIVFMITLSSAEIFLATLPVGAKIQHILDIVNDITLWFFIIEVSLRIWAAPEISPKYKGFLGRIRYCFTFYGFIDFISTYPFLIQYFVPLSFNAWKVLRTARIVRVLRITRYARSFKLLSDSIKEKKNELIVSSQFLIIVTFILSIILYIYEHDAQPDVYDNGISTVVWSFAKYIGDPGQMAETPPVTVMGKIIACIVGILGIAIVAVPAGILGAGFTEAIENRNKSEQISKNAAKLRNAFQRKLDRPSGFQVVPPFKNLTFLQARLAMKQDEIIEAVTSSEAPNFRLISTATTIPKSKTAVDNLAVEHYITNRPYGLCIDRGSRITIISPSSCVDAGISNFAFYVALLGNCNYISREIGSSAPFQSVFIHYPDNEPDEYEEFAADLEKLASRPGAWTLTLLVASGALEPEYPEHLHFGAGGKKGDETLNAENLLINDKETYWMLYEEMARVMKEELDLTSEHQRRYDTSNKNMILRKINAPEANHIVLRIEWHKILWDERRIVLASNLAQVLKKIIEGKELDPPAILKKKDIGFDGYDI